jgi:hypothetical protein
MGGFLSLYDEQDRIDLGGGYYVDIKRFLSDEDDERATHALTKPQLRSTMQRDKTSRDADATTTTTTIDYDQKAYSRALISAAIIGWNLTDRDGNPLPLAPDVAREASIRALPTFATKQILAKIKENENRTDSELTSFPGEVARVTDSPL